MAQSVLRTREAPKNPLKNQSAFSEDAQSALQEFLPKLVFVDDVAVVKEFRCQCCQRLALKPYVTDCKRLLCQHCFTRVAHCIRCPLAGCPKPTLCKGRHKPELQNGLGVLRVRCVRQDCKEIVPLGRLLDHLGDCLHRKQNLPSKQSKHHVSKSSVCIKQDHQSVRLHTEQNSSPKQLQPNISNSGICINLPDVNELRAVIQDMKREIIQLKDTLQKKTDEHKMLESSVGVLRKEVNHLRDITKDIVVAQLDTKRDALKKGIDHDSKTDFNLDVKEIVEMRSAILAIVEKQTEEMFKVHLKEFQEELKNQTEEIASDLLWMCSVECRKIEDELKNVRIQTFDIEQACAEYNEVEDEFKDMGDEWKDSLDSEIKRLRPDIDLMIIDAYPGPDWVKRFMKERRNEILSNVAGVHSCVKALEFNPEEGHWGSIVTTTEMETGSSE